MKLRVVHLLPFLTTGGAETVCADIATGIDPDRFESMMVSVYSRQDLQERIAGWGEDVAKVIASDTAVERRVRDAGIDVRCLNKTADLSAILRFKHIVRTFRPHIIHSHLTTVQYTLPMAVSHKPPARLHTMHTLAEFEAINSKNRWARRAFFATGGKPVAICETVARSVHDMYGVQPDVVFNRIDLQRLHTARTTTRQAWREEHGYTDDDVILLMVGRLRAVKNPQGLLKAFRPIAREFPAVKLVIAGDGDERAAMVAYIKEHDLHGQVRLLGNRSDVPDLLAAADVFVNNSRYEGLSIAIMEALAAGLPVVATGVGGTPELVDTGSTGLLVPEGEPDKMSTALRTMVNDAHFRSDCARRAQKDAKQRFDLAQTAEEYQALYERYRPRFR